MLARAGPANPIQAARPTAIPSPADSHRRCMVQTRIPLGYSPVPAYRRGRDRHGVRLYEAAYELNVTKCPMRSMGVAGIAQSDSGPAMATSWVRDCAAVMRSRFSTCFSTVRGDRDRLGVPEQPP